MSSKLIRVLLTVTVIGGALGFLFYSTLSKETEFYKHVDEVMASPTDWYGKRLKIHGYVVDNSILVNDQTLEYRFAMETNGKVIQTAYRGVVPDTFKSGAEVVVSGRLDGEGFHADNMTAKCPSKYDPADGKKAIAASSAGGGSE
ncbi:MAG: cytochrome c maturation protein CcmE [Acidobacteria bacterium]|nr:cytochrome c maturation protein CcmE [Acidobacteriota bacterium]MBP8275234.1 cytochrome c maturation protein CcmE [Acidobacteriota bacterium]